MFSKIAAYGAGMLLSSALVLSAVAQQESPAELRQEQAADQMAQQNAAHEPHMAAALKHLREAEEELEKANNEHGGHRVKAMDLTKQAESETEQGIQWYDQHVSPGAAAPGATSPAAASSSANPSKVPLFRLVSRTGDNHFYTTSAAERDRASKQGYRDEGVAGYVATSQVPGTVPLYRLVRQEGPRVIHLYTTSQSERDNAVRSQGFKAEGIAGYVPSSPQSGTAPLERLGQPSTGEYLYTTSRDEITRAVSRDRYQDQGTCCYVWTQS
jgi:uncharacterized protein DUF5648